MLYHAPQISRAFSLWNLTKRRNRNTHRGSLVVIEINVTYKVCWGKRPDNNIFLGLQKERKRGLDQN